METAIYHECMTAIRRHSDAYDYAMERLDHTTANAMIYEMQPIAGWFPLGTISVDAVYDQAVDPTFGQWQEFPEAWDLACRATEYVAEHWNDGDNGATDWAIEKFKEFASDLGLDLDDENLGD